MKKIMIEVTMDDTSPHQPIMIKQLMEGKWNDLELIGLMDTLKGRFHAHLNNMGKKFEGRFSGGKDDKEETE